MDLMNPDDEQKLLTFLYNGNVNHTIRLCSRIGVSYPSIRRYANSPNPLGRLRYEQMRKLVGCYNAEMGATT